MSESSSVFQSAAALFVFDSDLRVVCWNEAAEQLTGLPAAEVVGRACWEVVAGEDDEGGIVCHRGCSRARLVREGRGVASTEFYARTSEGRRRLSFETIVARGDAGPLFLHLMREAPPPERDVAAPLGPPPRLTPRQCEILGLIGEGQPVKTVAQRLGLMETTVRNHVRLLLIALGAHSQLEAVARARMFGLI